MGLNFNCNPPAVPSYCRCSLTCLETVSNLAPYIAALPSTHCNFSVRKHMRQPFDFSLKFKSAVLDAMVSCELEIPAWRQTATTEAYLSQSTLPDFNEMTVCFWFKGEPSHSDSYTSFLFRISSNQKKFKCQP